MEKSFESSLPKAEKSDNQVIESRKKTIEIVDSLDAALKERNLDEIQKFLKDAQSINSLIVRRGERNRYLEIIKDSFGMVLEERFGKGRSIKNIKGEDIIGCVHEFGLPEQILNEIAEVAFHEKDPAAFFEISDVIFKGAESLSNKQVLARAYHDVASWLASRDKNFTEAIEANHKAIFLARESKDRVTEEKALYGLQAHRDIRERSRAERFMKTSENLDKLGVVHDALRARIELATAMYKWSMQRPKIDRIDILEEAKDIAGECVNKAVEIGYPNAEILAREILTKIHTEKGDKVGRKKAKNHQKESERLREKYLY